MPYASGVISLTPPSAQRSQYGGQLDKVFRTEVRPSGGQDEERVRAFDVGPARRQRADASLPGLSEEDPVLAPGVGEPDPFELAPAQRVEPMGDKDSLRILAVMGS